MLALSWVLTSRKNIRKSLGDYFCPHSTRLLKVKEMYLNLDQSHLPLKLTNNVRSLKEFAPPRGNHVNSRYPTVQTALVKVSQMLHANI